jgi:cell division protease FtsH
VNSRITTVFFWILAIVVIVLLVNFYFVKDKGPELISYSEFITDVQTGKIKEVTVNEDQRRVDGQFVTKEKFYTFFISSDSDVWKICRDKNISITSKAPEQMSPWLAILMNFAPILLIGVIIFFVWRQMQNSGNNAFSFVKSRAKLFSSNQPKVTFNDVAGVEEAKEELKEIIAFKVPKTRR